MFSMQMQGSLAMSCIADTLQMQGSSAVCCIADILHLPKAALALCRPPVRATPYSECAAACSTTDYMCEHAQTSLISRQHRLSKRCSSALARHCSTSDLVSYTVAETVSRCELGQMAEWWQYLGPEVAQRVHVLQELLFKVQGMLPAHAAGQDVSMRGKVAAISMSWSRCIKHDSHWAAVRGTTCSFVADRELH